MLKTSIFGSIPSPRTNRLGPLHAYGLMIALGVLAGLELTARRWKARLGDPNDFWSIALWAVPAGLIGGEQGERYLATILPRIAHFDHAGSPDLSLGSKEKGPHDGHPGH